jgi:1-acyl-sn-glycerol-3-phosphate acyltransferase
VLPSVGELWRQPLPELRRWQQRLILRGMLSAFGRDVLAVHGASRLATAHDPFIVVLNHSTRLEALLLPVLFAFLRQGRLISFVADWNFALIPGVATILREGETILLVRKPVKPRFLNIFKPLFQRQGPAFERATRKLEAGRSVGFFPEGTTNRHPTRLLRGFDGAARLSLVTGCPVLPIGVRFPGQDPDQAIRDRTPMEIFVGAFLRPPQSSAVPSRDEVRAWHERIMREIGVLFGKQWDAGATRRKHHGLE